MEFLLFLSSIDREILELVYKADFKVEENTPLCLLGKRYFGFLKRGQKTVVICTRNAINIGGHSIPKLNHDEDNSMTPMYIRRALRHEAVHVAQHCNNGKTVNIVNGKKIQIHPFKKKALENSTKVSGNRERELEAYWMEDRPKLVKSALIKYCF